ncbi:MAG: RNA 2',3'-cyclic phosphodiesterase [Trueperaceae bacterium]|nr:RNA 2',3'-cyclic phosphodiesterase [Trueperaceae bacterium]
MANDLPTERLFLAVDPSPSQRRAVTDLQATLQDDARLARALRWSPPEQVHLTLSFLGDVAIDRRGAVVRAAALAARRTSPFTWRPSRLDGFPSAQRARVAWLDIAEGRDALVALEEALVAALSAQGVAPADPRAFTPHLTVARTRRGRTVALPQVEARAPLATAGHIRLIRSVLGADGARHDLIARLPFGAT